MPQHLCGLCKSSVHEHRTSPFKMPRIRLSCKAYLARLEQARPSVVHAPISIPDIESGGLNRSRAQLFSEPLLSTRRRMRRRGRSRVLTSVRTAARNFDLLLAIATPSTSAPALVETGMILIV